MSSCAARGRQRVASLLNMRANFSGMQELDYMSMIAATVPVQLREGHDLDDAKPENGAAKCASQADRREGCNRT